MSLNRGCRNGGRPWIRLELRVHVMYGVGIRDGRSRARVDPQPKLWSADGVSGVLTRYVQPGILREQEAENREIRFVRERARPEHVENTRVLLITARRRE